MQKTLWGKELNICYYSKNLFYMLTTYSSLYCMVFVRLRMRVLECQLHPVMVKAQAVSHQSMRLSMRKATKLRVETYQEHQYRLKTHYQ